MLGKEPFDRMILVVGNDCVKRTGRDCGVGKCWWFSSKVRPGCDDDGSFCLSLARFRLICPPMVLPVVLFFTFWCVVWEC